MQIGRLDFGHVAGDAIFCGDRAGGTGMIFGFFFGGAGRVTGEAILIVGGDIVGKRFVRIVAGHAGDARVAFGPAAAVFETIGSEAHVESARAHHLTGDDVLPGAVAGAAKIDRIDTSELRGIERQPGASLFGFGSGSGDMLCAGAVAGFAGDA